MRNRAEALRRDQKKVQNKDSCCILHFSARGLQDICLHYGIRYCMAAWFGSLSVQLKTRIAKIVNTAMKVIGKSDPQTLQTIFEKKVLRLAQGVMSDLSHILFSEYEMLPSGRRLRACRPKSNRYKNSFLPNSIALLNKQPVHIHASINPRLVAS